MQNSTCAIMLVSLLFAAGCEHADTQRVPDQRPSVTHAQHSEPYNAEHDHSVFSAASATLFPTRLQEHIALQQFLDKRGKINQRPGTYLEPDELALLTAACYWCEIRLNVSHAILMSLIASGNYTAAYEAIEVLTARTPPHQQGYRDMFALKKADILCRWARKTDAAEILEQIIEGNVLKTNVRGGNACFIQAHWMLAEIRTSQGRLAEAHHSIDELLRCPLDEETRKSFEEQRKILLEPGYHPNHKEANVTKQ